MRSTLITVAALMLLPLSVASAQTVQARSGDRVRVTAKPYGLENRIGRVESARNDSLFLQVAPNETLGIPVAGINQLDVSTGRSRHVLRSAGIGALVGAATGAFIGLADGDDPKESFLAFTAGEKAAMGGIVLGGAGLVIGTLIGALNVSEHWTSVPLGDTRATPNLQLGVRGARLGVAVAF